jgi:outer membrane protein OmpU
MKKVLFATTALVATAGVAAADVTFGGYGRVGVIYSDTAANGSNTDVTSRFRLQIDATAESDMGVTFGARARIQQEERGAALGVTDAVDDAANSGTGINGVRFFARSGGFEVGVGNIYGALESMPGQYTIDLGLTGLGYQYTAFRSADAYSSDGAGAAGANGVEVLYSMGDLAVHISASDTNDRVAAYAAYTFNGITLALGGQDSDDADDTDVTATIGGSFAGANVSFGYADNGDTDGDRFVLAGDYAVGAATTLQAYIADDEFGADTGYGIGAHHDLGGGVSLRGGFAHLTNGDDRADLGVRFNF